jgi:hypothetical protein
MVSMACLPSSPLSRPSLHPVPLRAAPAPAPPHLPRAERPRLRKDPLDPIDSGTKVAILFQRMTDPEFVRREEEAKKKKEAADKAAAAAAPKKAGAWGGLPGARR